MNIRQETFGLDVGWKTILTNGNFKNPQLVLAFGNRRVIAGNKIYDQIRKKYPNAEIIVNSTSGEISDHGVMVNSVVLTAIEFEHTKIKTYCLNIDDFLDSASAGCSIINNLESPDLSHLFIISDGQLINGSDLVKGLNTLDLESVLVTGGLAGDGHEFSETLVGLNENPSGGNVIGIGFYGNRLAVGVGSKGGWDSFGPERKVTKSSANVLYELDGLNALEIYKKYLGEAAEELPSSALYFPLAIKTDLNQEPIVRSILSVNEEDQSMTFAGDIPQGAIARLMKHNPDRLIDGAEQAALYCRDNSLHIKEPELMIMVSCVGRKIVLGQNIDEEIEVVRDLVGNNTVITGFYSYGEIGPVRYASQCELHNQTMTITAFSEI